MSPNLFIPGAAKCGTTSLYTILRQHPDIHASRIKEPTFFNWPHQMVPNPSAYFSLFNSPKRYRMDSSVAYLTNPATAPVLRSLFPDAKFIVSVRDPKARAYSLYRFMRWGGREDAPTFHGALTLEASRYTSAEFWQTCATDIWFYLYCRSSQYDQHLSRYFSLFHPHQFHVLSLAELSRDPIGTTRKILEFLELDPGPARGFDYAIRNRQEIDRPPYDEECDRIMTDAFEGLIERTNALVGRSLDWSI